MPWKSSVTSAISTALRRGVRWKALPVLLLIVAGVFTFHSEVRVPSDLLLYMSYAQNLALGNGYADFNGELTLRRGPGYPLMIQFAWWLLGNSTRSAFWVVRIFCIANPVLVYLLGKRLFNRRVGFAAGALMLTSFSLNFWSYRHLDAIWPFFAYASVLVLYRAFELERFSFAIAAGLLSAAAFLVKESAVLFLPLPVVLVAVVAEFRTRKHLVLALACTGFALGAIGPWLYWTREDGISGLNRVTELVGSSAGLIELVRLFFTGLSDYYTTQLASRFSIAPLLLASWVFVGIRSFGRGKGARVCLACLVLLAPYAAYVGAEGMRPGQLVVLFLLNYLVASFFLYSLAEWISTRLARVRAWNRERVIRVVFFLLVLPVLLLQLFVSYKKDRGGLAFLARSELVDHLQGDPDEDEASLPVEQGKEYIRGVAEWFEKHATPDAVISVGDGGMDYGRALFLQSDGRLRLRNFPMVEVRFATKLRKPSIRWKNRVYTIASFEFPPADDLLFFRRQGSGWLLFETNLLRQLEAQRADYVVLGPNLCFLGEYFRANPSFSQVAYVDDGKAQIFKVGRRLNHVPHPVFVGNRRLRSEFWLDLLTKRVGLKEHEALSLEAGDRPSGFVTGVSCAGR